MKDPAVFADDIVFQDMIHALTIRSPVARGILKSIECARLPNSYHLITAKHIPGKNELAGFHVPVLADKQLSYIGQPVAILAGPDETKLEQLSSGIKLVMEESVPAEPASTEPAPAEPAPADPADVIVSRNIVFGKQGEDPAKTGKTIAGSYSTGIQEHWYSEPHGAVAAPPNKKNEDTVTLYTATQWPFHVRQSAARVLGWDIKKVKIEPALLALHLDGKIWYPSLLACHAALAALITQKPVKLMLTREEDFMFSPKRNGAKILIQSILDDNGRINATNVNATLDLGSEGVFEDEIIDQTCLGSLGVYHHPAFVIEGRGIRTDIPPQGPMAGFGLSQGFFAAERQASRIADSLGMDPAEWRKNNFLVKNQNFAIGTALKNHVLLPELIDAVSAMSDYRRKWASYELLRTRRRAEKWEFPGYSGGESLRGIGITTAFQGNGFLYSSGIGAGGCSAELRLEKDGSLEITASLIISGAGYAESLRNMAQEILGIDPAMIRVKDNSEEISDSLPGALSRNIGMVSTLVERCCTALRSQRSRLPLPITVKRSAKPGKAPGWVQGKDIDPETFARPGWGAAVIETEIDPISFIPLIRGIWLVADGGKILSRHAARSVLRAGVIQALGWTYREQIRYTEGRIPQELYRSFDLAAPVEIPSINVDLLQNDAAGPKGIGDLPFHCVPAAYVQAVSQAMDHPFEKLPLDAGDIWDAAQLKQKELP